MGKIENSEERQIEVRKREYESALRDCDLHAHLGYLVGMKLRAMNAKDRAEWTAESITEAYEPEWTSRLSNIGDLISKALTEENNSTAEGYKRAIGEFLCELATGYLKNTVEKDHAEEADIQAAWWNSLSEKDKRFYMNEGYEA